MGTKVVKSTVVTYPHPTDLSMISRSGSKGPAPFLSKVPMHGLHRGILIQSLFSKLATFNRRNRLSMNTEHREAEVKFRTDSALFLSSKRNVIVQDVILVYPDLRKKDRNQGDHRLSSEHLKEFRRDHSQYRPRVLTRRACTGSRQLKNVVRAYAPESRHC